MDYTKEYINHDIVRAKPMPSVKELEEFYSQLYYQKPESSTYQTEYPQWEIDYKRLRANILMYAFKMANGKEFEKNRDKFLDIGCGEGFALQEGLKEGLKVFGFDFSEFGIKKFHPNLLPHFEIGEASRVLDKMLKQGQKFNFCSILNVLEHVIDPIEMLKSLKPLLATDGILAVTVPNDFSEIQKKAEQLGHINKQFWFCPPHHLHYFNSKNISAFVEDCGFQVVDQFADFPIDLFLFHPGSNYIAEASNGPAAHRARIEIDTLLAKSGNEKYLNLLRAMSKCGLGRNVTVLLKAS